jgi:hypothetical protein
MYYWKGDIYEGDWICNKRQGQGKMEYYNETTYIGEWILDRWNGSGVYISDTIYNYTGDCYREYVINKAWNNASPVDLVRPSSQFE